MNKNLTRKRDFIVLLAIAFVLIIISFLLVSSFSIFPNHSSKVYVDPETGNESTYDSSYYTEEDIKKIREGMDHSDIPEEQASEETQLTPEP